MKEYYLHISDIKEYSEDLGILRKEREKFLINEINKITLIWSNGDGHESLSIFAIGPNLWVDAFESLGSITLKFEERESKQNYQESDNPGMIDALAMTNALTSFMCSLGEIHEWKTMSVFKTPEKNSLLKTKLRNTYLICIFLASESVRNEFFELIYCNYSGIVSWRDCKVLFQNWKTIAMLLYPGGTTSDIIPIVSWADWRTRINGMPAGVSKACENIKYKLINSK